MSVPPPPSPPRPSPLSPLLNSQNPVRSESHINFGTHCVISCIISDCMNSFNNKLKKCTAFIWRVLGKFTPGQSPPPVNFPRWNPPGNLANPNLTRLWGGIHRGELTRVEFSGHHLKNGGKTSYVCWYVLSFHLVYWWHRHIHKPLRYIKWLVLQK